jgi:hypothetical protein
MVVPQSQSRIPHFSPHCVQAATTVCSTMASASASSSAPGSHAGLDRFDPGPDDDFRSFLADLALPGEKEAAMLARKWRHASGHLKKGVPAPPGFRVVEDNSRELVYELRWFPSAPELADLFPRLCPEGLWLSVTIPHDYPMSFPTVKALPSSVRTYLNVPGKLVANAISRVCTRQAHQTCEHLRSSVGGDSTKGPASAPIRAALSALDKGFMAIFSTLQEHAPKIQDPSAAGPEAASCSAIAADEGTAEGYDDPVMAEKLLKASSALDEIEASTASVLDDPRPSQALRRIGVQCGEIMIQLDAIDCGPPGSSLREMRRTILHRAEAIASNAEAIAAEIDAAGSS